MLPGWEEGTNLGISQRGQRRTSQNQFSYSTSFLSCSFPLNPDHVLLLQASQVVRVVERWGFDPQVRKIPWRRKCQPTPVLLPGKSHERRSQVGYSPWGRKESDTTERLHFTHSDVLDHLCCKNSDIFWLQTLPFWRSLSSEMLCPRLEILRISTEYSVILNI